ncbi:hypothetical protein EK21DRAFT_62027 [Setomelanomma holmii]|uniref:Zn(2)-C6 fungal-type domain-containing protein n=1 Tax=Setomelanomma holmii TaxID=210430 RepID=A0A9P4HCB5_9PLEO|nr:hypothetical protein EK21DRAFT_62027 [Setomelanomma holmii]
MSHDFTTQLNSAPYSPAPSHFSQSSMADPNGQQSRQQQQPVAYPSPHSYPSPSMQPTYTYPPSQGQQSNEPYRGSPQGTNMSLPSLNLPPIRLQDGQQPPPPQPQAPQQPMGSPLPPPPHSLPQYYGHQPHPHAPPGQQMMANMGPAQYNAQMRYQLPLQHNEQRVLSGGRHKKEIKRRTKTGCLTCRKRRIKCDEAHPSCRNCQKSKRECLGYDPIFKQQPGPAQIQPAPNSGPAPHSTTPVPAPAPPASSTYSQSPVPQGYAPASSSGYAPVQPATSGTHPSENYNAIDPALAAPPGQPMHQGQPQYNGVHDMNSAMGGPPGATAYAQPPPPLQATRGKKLVMADIFGICNHSPPEVPVRQSRVPDEVNEDFQRIFLNDYLQGLDMMLQTTWYSTNGNALSRAWADRALHEEAAYFTECMRDKSQTGDMAGVFSQEARLIWNLLGTCKLPEPPNANGTQSQPTPEANLALREVQARFDILECLLTNQSLATNPLRSLSYGQLSEAKKGETDFWLFLGDFVQSSGADNAPPGAAEHALGVMRNVLQVQEVRDAIYSIAIARHCGAQIGGFPNRLPPPSNQQEDSELNKLIVAMSFISHESRQGSQQVLARICDMAMLSWEVARPAP